MNRYGWKGHVAAHMAESKLSMQTIVRYARQRGLRIGKSSASEIWQGVMRPTDRFVAAVSIVLNVHPERLGFEREPTTELGFLAFEAVNPGQSRYREQAREVVNNAA